MLYQTLLINEDVFHSIFDYLLKEGANKTAQPNLIIGEAGSGKTYLLNRVIDKIIETDEMRLYPVFIEGKSLFYTNDIWRRCAVRLKLENSTPSFENIISWQNKTSYRIVLFIDNIQYYFKRTDNLEHYDLRGKVNRVGSPILIATSNEVIPAFTDYNAAFFEGFKISYVKPVSSSEIEAVLGMSFDSKRIDALMKYLPKTIRSLLIIKGLMLQSQNGEMDLMMLLNLSSSQYQAKYDSCVTQVQRILSALSISDDGMNLQGIRDYTKQENGKLSPYLKIMVDQKLVKKFSKTPRGATYNINDPLFQLWLRNYDSTRSE